MFKILLYTIAEMQTGKNKELIDQLFPEGMTRGFKWENGTNSEEFACFKKHILMTDTDQLMC